MPSHAFNGCHLKPPEQYAKWKTPLATFRLPISSFSSIIACLTICLLIYHQSTHGNSTNQPHPSSCQPENNSTNLPALKTMTTITNLPAYSKDHQNRSLPDLPQVTLWPCTTERCFCMLLPPPTTWNDQDRNPNNFKYNETYFFENHGCRMRE